MWRPRAPTNFNLHQLSTRMKRKMIMMNKKSVSQVLSIDFIKTREHHFQVWHNEERAMSINHQGASLIFFMFIN